MDKNDIYLKLLEKNSVENFDNRGKKNSQLHEMVTDCR